MLNRRPGAAAVLWGLLVAGGCASGGPDSWPALRPGGLPSDLPVAFRPADPSLLVPPVDTLAGGGCLNPLLDPRGDVRLTLVRSLTREGDYAVSAGGYGLGSDELLRIDCNTGRPLGVVRR